MAKMFPQFIPFLQNNCGKSSDQIAKENGIDFGQLQRSVGGVMDGRLH